LSVTADGRSADGRIRVVVADDHPLYRQALARAVRDDDRLELAGEAGDGARALELIDELSPDVALLDMAMPRMDALNVLDRLAQSDRRLPVVIVSAAADGATVQDAISRGAAGFLTKDAEAAEICQALIDVTTGRSVLSPKLQSAMFRHLRDAATRAVKLSPRERELLELGARGMSGPEIAQALMLSPATVKTYWQRLYEKLEVGDRASAVAEALRRGLIE
jgi:two-component system nitrate/nitrite response regulator NarL